MKVGVKIGPIKWQEVLEQTQARYCEVWFRLDWREQFSEIFSYLKAQQINFGLHFWAILPGGLEPNLAYEKNGIANETQKLIRQCIDVASTVGASYVNTHPGSLLLKKLDLTRKELIFLTGQEVDASAAQQSLLVRAQELDAYAKKKNVLFLIETVPKNEAWHWRDFSGHLRARRGQNVPPEFLYPLTKAGISLTNDFGHSAASWEESKREVIFAKLKKLTERLASQTKLIHLTTNAPPFNGTDSHNGILPKDFASGVLPDENQLRQLLSLFQDRDDVWIIPEPEIADMVDNYFALVSMVNSL